MRRGLRYRDGKAWTAGHLRWLKGLSFEHAHFQQALDEYRLALDEAAERLKRFEVHVEEAADEASYKKLASLLMALRGVKVITAMTIIAESVDLKRYWSAPAYMDAIGVVSSEYSTGDKRHQGPITKTGNAHLRRVLVESAWHYRWAPGLSETMKKRRKDVPPEILAIVRKADQRLRTKFTRLVNRRKSNKIAAVAVAENSQVSFGRSARQRKGAQFMDRFFSPQHSILGLGTASRPSPEGSLRSALTPYPTPESWAPL